MCKLFQAQSFQNKGVLPGPMIVALLNWPLQHKHCMNWCSETAGCHQSCFVLMNNTCPAPSALQRQWNQVGNDIRNWIRMVWQHTGEIWRTHLRLCYPTMAGGSNGHFHVFEIWHKNKFCLKYLRFNKMLWLFDVWACQLVLWLHLGLGNEKYNLLPFAMVFLKLAYLFCVQIVRKQQCLNIIFNYLKVLNLY